MALVKFDFKYKNAWTDGIQFNTLVTQFESGKEQRRAKGLPRRIFKLTFAKTSNYNDDAEKMWQFFIARKGQYESFLWDYPKSDGTIEEVTVRFNDDNMSRDRFIDKAYNLGLTLIEVL